MCSLGPMDMNEMENVYIKGSSLVTYQKRKDYPII